MNSDSEESIRKGRSNMSLFRWRKRRARRGKVNLTQYLESRKDQDMKRLLCFTRTQERRRGGGVGCFGMEERRVYIVVVKKI